LNEQAGLTAFIKFDGYMTVANVLVPKLMSLAVDAEDSTT